MPAPTAATPQMILKYEMKVAYRCSVSKSCGTSGCCESLATDCSLLITTRDRVDFNEGWGVPGDMMHHGVDKWIEGAGVRIMDDAVNYCFELGRPGGGIAVDFDIHASHSESFSRTHDCK